MRCRKLLILIGSVLFILSLPMMLLDYTGNLPIWLKEIFNHPFLFGLCMKDLSHIGLVWKMAIGLICLFLLTRNLLRRGLAYLLSYLPSS